MSTLPLAAQEPVDLATIDRIKAEAQEHSQVMDIVSWLTDVYGPRLTGSPLTKAASDWAVATMQSWRLSDVHLEQWNPYDSGQVGESWSTLNRGWTNEQFAFRAVTPYPFVINALPSVWSPSTNGRIAGPAIRFDAHSLAEMQQRFAGKLKGAFLLMDAAQPTPAHFEPQASRLTDSQLERLAGRAPATRPTRHVVEMHYNALEDIKWLVNEGAAVLLFSSPGDSGTIAMAVSNGGSLPAVTVSAESYGRIVRILEKNIPVMLELEMQNTFYDNPDVFNILAEIPGIDAKLKAEIVMIGAHFDSWTFGTGATDNAAGAAVMMEAMRILKALDLQPRRTIRLGLWTGEEQGNLGSYAYVQRHLRDWYRHSQEDSSATKPEYDRFSVYFNLDNGAGKIRGIYQNGNAALGPVFEAWMGAFKDPGMKTTTMASGGGGDLNAFQRVGLPAFGFIQDPLEYGTRTHHTSADVYERVQPEDLRFNAAVLASFAWQAAQRDEKPPRLTTSLRP